MSGLEGHALLPVFMVEGHLSFTIKTAERSQTCTQDKKGGEAKRESEDTDEEGGWRRSFPIGEGCGGKKKKC